MSSRLEIPPPLPSSAEREIERGRREIVDTRQWARVEMPEGVTVGDLAVSLSRLARWGGRTSPAPFSVAQHSCNVADQIYRETRNPLAALYGLAHDGHEPIIGEIPAKAKVELCRLARRNVVAFMEEACDALIFPCIGLAYPMPDAIAEVLRVVDARAAATEVRDLNVPDIDRAALAEPYPQPIGVVWPWPKAEDNYVDWWNRYAIEAGVKPAERGRL